MMVTILMATFNGAKYISEQLDSILAQTYTDWELIIRDDLSTDQTLSIIWKYVEADSRIKLLPSTGPHGSAVQNFSMLFDYAVTLSTPYIMFADQDDVWKTNKVESSIAYIQRQESRTTSSYPILIYGALQYVDTKGHIIPQKLNMPAALNVRMLLTENHAYGCTMILNRALVQQIGHIPVTAENHDYWVALVACTLGNAVLNPEILISYRQHANNVSGNVHRNRLSSRMHRYIKKVDFLLPVFVKNFNMINAYYNIYRAALDSETRALIGEYITAYKSDVRSLMSFMVKNNIRKFGRLQTLAHYYTIVQLRRKVLEQL